MIDQCFFEREFGKGLGIGDSNLGIGNRIVSSHRLIYIYYIYMHVLTSNDPFKT